MSCISDLPIRHWPHGILQEKAQTLGQSGMDEMFKHNTVQPKICIFGGRASMWRLGMHCLQLWGVCQLRHTQGKLKSQSMTAMTTAAHCFDLCLTSVKPSLHSFFTAPEMVNAHSLLYWVLQTSRG